MAGRAGGLDEDKKMPRLNSIRELEELRSIIVGDRDVGKPRIVVCAGTACQASGSSDIIRAAKRHIIGEQLLGKVALRVTGCHGFCEMGPFILTEPQNAFYSQVKIDDVPRIIDALLAGEYVEELLFRDPKTGKRYFHRDEIPFFKNQERSILALNQRLDPIRIYDYLAADGYRALGEVLDGAPGRVIEQMIASGLRGRGGAGFLTGRKWQFLAGQPSGGGKYLVCNADEGDPGAYMDRSILEGNPHSIIEGMVIGAYGTGATKGIVYVRAEYPLAIKHLLIALNQAREQGVLGEDILGTGFGFDIEIVRGAGAFVCGEETALIRSVEGMIGEPRQRPPYPIEKGINGRPTAINNVETWANVPQVFRLGADEYAAIGTEGNSGTKIFSLVGKIKNTGLVEVPMGVTIGEVVYDIGGGPSGSSKIKAVQTGGPSGGCIPASEFGLQVDYDSLAAAGSIMGSGGMIVMDESTCMVDVARYYMNFLKDESCGKCFSCRKGTQRMYEILDDVARGVATVADLDLLEELAEAVKDSTMCGLGQTASNPVLSTLKHFRAEYERHVIDKRCDARVCKELTGAPCQASCPLGTEVWRYVAHIRRGELEEAYRVIRAPNPFPSVCARVCNHPCEAGCRAGDGGGEAVAIRALKRYVTDRVDPGAFRPRRETAAADAPRVAVIGAGPSGLTAAHYLSLAGHRVTVFESDAEPGGMLLAAIPEYRLPRELVKAEIEALLDDNITLECGRALGVDFTLDELLEDGFGAVYVALGAHRSRRLGLEGEDAGGVYPSIEFLKAHNLRGESLARGRVGVIGGGNSAIDAARVALRQEGVDSVTILYRRTRDEMPAFPEEIDAALEEGIALETLVTPARIVVEGGRLEGIELSRNELGGHDASGRRSPVPVEGSEHLVELDTMIVAISEGSDVAFLEPECAGTLTDRGGRLPADRRTARTARDRVFAGGDVATGPRTVVDAIAAGKRAATMIGRLLGGEELVQTETPLVPRVYLAPDEQTDEALLDGPRRRVPHLPLDERRSSFGEVELSFSDEDAVREASRCLRCDLEFTRPADAADATEGRRA
jgi:NADH-quinone oxidoreductase subunit F